MAKRRAPKVVWLPPDRFNCLGTGPGVGATSGLQNGIKHAVIPIPSGTGSAHTEVFPVVQDAQTDATLLSGGSLADYEQSAYRLRRVVGKIFIGGQQEAVADLQTETIVTAGLIVLRTHQVGGVIVPLNTTTEEYSTQMLQNWGDPWIWRRTWVIGNIPQAVSVGARELYPETNITVAGNLDGPHVDAKTARIIGPEERLYLVITGAAVNGDPQVFRTMRYTWDLRVLASMRSSQGNRRNASR